MKNKKLKISAVLIAKDEEEKIEDCLKSLDWTDEIVFIDTGSKDRTVEIAGKYTEKIFKSKSKNFDDWKNEALKKVEGEWVLNIDADERITPLLKEEITKIINNPAIGISAYAIPRKNIILGKEMKHGGWWPDYVKRLFKKEKLEKWVGELHEEPVFKGNLGHITNPMIHLKHSDISGMVDKTNKWSAIEAKLLIKSNHPRMSWWRFFRVFLSELYYRLIRLQGYLDGAEGIIYAFYQSWSRFITYAKLWEMQLNAKNIKS